MLLYRLESQKNEKIISCNKYKTMRKPSNVPYIVDNLWEWKRPGGYPNRRFAVFASPSPELARASSQKEGRIYRVEFPKNHNCLIGQLNLDDSKHHPDCHDLPLLLFNLLGQGWLDSILAEKEKAGRLWMPCLKKEEMEQLFRSDPLTKIKDEIWCKITYWDDVYLVPADSKSLPHPEGEVFFEADEWRLIEI